jgi:hypothetical protein
MINDLLTVIVHLGTFALILYFIKEVFSDE